MIKPFEILETRDYYGNTGVSYSVSYWEVNSDNTVRTKRTLNAFLIVPAGNDIDAYLFEKLKEAGWIE